MRRAARCMLAAVVAGAGMMGCASRQRQEPAAQSGPVIVKLVGRDKVVVVSKGKDGVIYSVTTKSGQALISDATEEQLRVLQPDVYRELKMGIAVDASKDDR